MVRSQRPLLTGSLAASQPLQVDSHSLRYTGDRSLHISLPPWSRHTGNNHDILHDSWAVIASQAAAPTVPRRFCNLSARIHLAKPWRILGLTALPSDHLTLPCFNQALASEGCVWLLCKPIHASIMSAAPGNLSRPSYSGGSFQMRPFGLVAGEAKKHMSCARCQKHVYTVLFASIGKLASETQSQHALCCYLAVSADGAAMLFHY
jgi:hypothetical protein